MSERISSIASQWLVVLNRRAAAAATVVVALVALSRAKGNFQRHAILDKKTCAHDRSPIVFLRQTETRFPTTTIPWGYAGFSLFCFMQQTYFGTVYFHLYGYHATTELSVFKDAETQTLSQVDLLWKTPICFLP